MHGRPWSQWGVFLWQHWWPSAGSICSTIHGNRFSVEHWLAFFLVHSGLLSPTWSLHLCFHLLSRGEYQNFCFCETRHWFPMFCGLSIQTADRRLGPEVASWSPWSPNDSCLASPVILSVVEAYCIISFIFTGPARGSNLTSGHNLILPHLFRGCNLALLHSVEWEAATYYCLIRILQIDKVVKPHLALWDN